MTARITTAAVLLLTVHTTSAVAAQVYAVEELSRYDAPSALPGLRGEVTLAAANGLLGGVVSGVVRELRGGSFRQGFTAGAVGSVVAYSGRRLSVLDFHGAGLLGREVNAVGASMVRNATAGAPLLSELVLPLGPARLYVRDGRRLRLKLNAYELYWLTRGVLDPALALQWESSVSTGAPVFQRRSGRLQVSGEEVNGYALGGSVFLSRDAGLGQHWTLAHETVHVLQSDFAAIAWLDPAELGIMGATSATSAVSRVFDVGVFDTALRTALVRGLRFQWWQAAHEFEAELLESR